MTDALRLADRPVPSNRRVGVIVGSTRPNRICRDLANWVIRVLQSESELHYEIIDLIDVALPFLDEPFPAALGRYEHEHTKAWSRLVSSFDAFVFVFPQYNWGYPAPLKNALDFLYCEWEAKPAALVTYGNRGGGKGADQIRGVLQGLHMQTLEENVQLRITRDDFDEKGQLVDLETIVAPSVAAVRALDERLVAAFNTAASTAPAAS